MSALMAPLMTAGLETPYCARKQARTAAISVPRARVSRDVDVPEEW
jgi:hypothetical protein